ncbi:MAG: rhodanese-like domain-containing protein [Gemmatimonadetes bacterium]|jgi:rhodanese-related sulfurtransferase|nr:rhodanese-like domain-containing protein [Gemmatimonadota bacterium]MBT7859341.1 rhodanese-like domain-containing protein [Gemmatimonadota bacterium]
MRTWRGDAPAPVMRWDPRRRTRWLAMLGILLAGFSCIRLDADDWPLLTEGIRQRYPNVRQITTTEWASWQAHPDTVQPLLLDVRTPAEFAISHLSGAQRADELTQALTALSDAAPDTPILLYCSVGYRSSRLADQLRQRGYTQVANLEGSLFAWANEGRPLVDEHDKATHLAHPYNATWGKLLKPELIWKP